MVRRGRAQSLIGRIIRRPFALVPAPAENPLTTHGRRSPLLDALDNFFFRRNVFEIQANQALAKIDQVRVRINDAWQNHGSVKVYGARGLGIEALRFVRAADPRDAIALNGDGLRGGLFVIHGDDVCVEEKPIGAGRLC